VEYGFKHWSQAYQFRVFWCTCILSLGRKGATWYCKFSMSQLAPMMMPPCQALVVSVIQAEGLQHMNHFTGDHPYCVCEVKHADPSAPTTKAETKPVTEGDTINPVWNETLELEAWQPGEALEFTVYDKGLIGSKTEGKAMLPSEFFYPNGFRGMISVIGLLDARLRIEVLPPAGATAPMSQLSNTCAAPAGSAYQSQAVTVPPTVQTAEPHQLAVSILEAHGLQHMNHFTGDHPYVTCEVKHIDSSMATTKVETKPVTEGDSLNPFWGETHRLGPWYQGEPLEFTVYHKGLIGSKTEGKVVLPPELFYPHGFSGMLSISSLPHALLHVIIRPLGPMPVEGTTMESVESVVADATKLKKKKKLKVGKKSKSCC